MNAKAILMILVAAMFAVGLTAQTAAKADAKEAGKKEGEAKSEKKEALTLDQLPAAAKAAITKLAGDNKLGKLKEKGKESARQYQAEWTTDGKDHEALVAADGSVIKTEDDVDAKDVPQAVQDAAKAAAPEGATLEYVKIHVTKGDATTYEVTPTSGGKELKTLLFNSEGKVQADDDDDDDDGEEEDDDDGDDD